MLEGFDSYRRWVGGFIWYFELRIGNLKILIDMGFGLKFLRIGKLGFDGYEEMKLFYFN